MWRRVDETERQGRGEKRRRKKIPVGTCVVNISQKAFRRYTRVTVTRRVYNRTTHVHTRNPPLLTDVRTRVRLCLYGVRTNCGVVILFDGKRNFTTLPASGIMASIVDFVSFYVGASILCIAVGTRAGSRILR